MNTPTVKIVTTTKRVHIVPSPAPWKDINDAIEFINGKRRAEGKPYSDDAVTVRAFDEEIHFEEVIETEVRG